MQTTKLFLSNSQFLKKFETQLKKKKSNPLCWVLGSGASRQSGIRMGRDITNQWLNELYVSSTSKLKSKPPIEKWAKAEFKDIPEFNYSTAVNWYPYVYQRRFKNSPDEGFKFLEKEMVSAKPSFGYSVLAQIMAGSKHNIALTTNFDYLLSLSLVSYRGVLPIDCGHESIASYASFNLQRPIIARLHRDLMIAPKKSSKELKSLHAEWKKPLETVFNRSTPIIIGFGDSGGAGGSVMGFLEQIPPIKTGLYWCYREKDPGALPDKKVQAVVKKHNGHLVPILGFDELMLQLWDKFLLTSLHNDLISAYDDLVKHYEVEFSNVIDSVRKQSAISPSPTALSSLISAQNVSHRLASDSQV